MTVEFIRGLKDFRLPEGRRTIVTVGTFDGIHRGHQEIFRRVRRATAESDGETVLITFHPHPRVLVSPSNVPMLLTTIEEKEKFVPDYFEGRVLVLEFNETLKNMSADQFVKDILVEKAHVRRLIVGYDHGFGRNREGTIPALRDLGEKHDFSLEVVDPVFYGGVPVSSSRIRRAMTEGQYAEAVDLLGHDYAISGRVESGIGLGRKIGYPTANIQYGPRKLLPPQGVYACWAEVAGQDWCGMLFVGQNYFNPVQTVTVEVNLFDFDREIYDEEIVVYPTRFIRGNQRFASTELLVQQIERDKGSVMKIVRKGEKQCQ